MIQTLQKYIFSPAAVLVIVVIFLWLPFGLNKTIGGLEEWATLERLQKGYPVFFTPHTDPTRPINFSPYGTASVLIPDNVFLSYNLVIIGVFIAKALVAYGIVRKLVPQNSAIALVTAVLFIIYPADAGLFSFRALPNQVTVLAGILAVYLLLYYWQKPSVFLWVSIWTAQAACLLIYELLYPVLFVSPLLLIWMDKRPGRRFWRITFLWMIIPSILFALLVWNVMGANYSQDTYIGVRLAEARATGATSLGAILSRIPALYERHISEWGFTINELAGRSPYWSIAVLIGLLVGLFCWRLLRQIAFEFKPSSALMFSGVGLILIFLGYAAFLPSSYGNTHWRVYIITSLGAAMCINGLVFGLFQRSSILVAGISGMLVALATLHALDQHSIYIDSSAYLQRMLGSIVQQAPQIDPEAIVVLLDNEAAIAQSDWRLSGYDDALRGALGYLYGKPIQAIFCNETDILGDPQGKRLCLWQSEGIYRLFGGVETTYPYEHLIVFQTQAGGEAKMLTALSPEITMLPGTVNYDPGKLVKLSAPLPARAATLFTCWPVETCFPLDSPPQDHIWLGFDRIVRGIGWESATPERRQLWMTAKQSTIFINPTTDKPLEIEFRISQTPDADILSSLKLAVNGEPIKIHRIDPQALIFQGTIPQSALRDETELAFSVDRIVDPYGLGLEFDWLEIKPIGGNNQSDQVRIEFDREINGTGWEAPIPDRSQLWMLDTHATMNFYPTTNKDLEIQFKIDLYLQQDILDSLQLIVNGQPIALERSENQGLIFRGIIPKSALSDETQLQFVIDRVVSPASLGTNSDTRGLGLLFDWLEIRPVS